MRNRYFRVFVFIFSGLLLAGQHLLAQSPWVRSKAGFYAQLSWQFIPEYHKRFSDNANLRYMHRAIREDAVQLYGEYGLSRKTTATIALPLRRIESGAQIRASGDYAAGTLLGIGNISLGIRHSLGGDAVKAAASLRVDLPTQAYQSESGLRTGFPATTILPMISVGRGYRRAYWFAYGGYGFRTEGYNHFINLGLEAGLKLRKFWLIGFTDVHDPTTRPEVELPLFNQQSSLYVPNQAYVAVGGKISWSPSRFWGITGSAAGAAYGRNVPAQPAYSLGAFFKWD